MVSSFEAASLKPAAAPARTGDDYNDGYNAGVREGQASMGLRVVGERVNVTDGSLKDLIRLAYQVQVHQISGPPWLASEKFDVAAVMPAGSSRSQAPAMLRALLEERFHLMLHRETKSGPVYALVEAKGGIKLKPVEEPANGERIASRTSFQAGYLMARASPVAVFADLLAKAADRPVIDMTGLAGLYDFNLKYTTALSATEPDESATLGSALQEQLGLKLEKREMPVEILVIDHADRVPAGN